MRIQEGDRWKTAFRARYCHFKYQVMLFGLFNALASFQSYINIIFTEKLDIFVIVYLDDILVYIEDPGQTQIDAVCWVLDQLRKHNLYTDLKKYRFHQDKVCFLGFVVLVQSIRMKERQLRQSKPGQSQRQLRIFKYF